MNVEAENAVLREKTRIKNAVQTLFEVENNFNSLNPLVSKADVLDIIDGKNPIMVKDGVII